MRISRDSISIVDKCTSQSNDNDSKPFAYWAHSY